MALLSRAGLFRFAVFHQQVLDVRFTLNTGQQHLDSPMCHNFYYVLITTWRVQYTSPFD